MELPATDHPHVLVVTGMSGAGRSSAAKILEDLGYTVIDNLPPRLLVPAAEAHDIPEQKHKHLAVVIDSRGGLPIGEIRDAVKELSREGKIVPDAPPGKGRISDPRRFVYVEACGEVGTAALALAVQVGGDWIASDRGVPEYRIVRDGCFRAAVPLPRNATAREIRALRAQAYTRVASGNTPPPIRT